MRAETIGQGFWISIGSETTDLNICVMWHAVLTPTSAIQMHGFSSANVPNEAFRSSPARSKLIEVAPDASTRSMRLELVVRARPGRVDV